LTSPMAKYWLMKSEPETFSLEQLKKDKKTWWTGVRNYLARNHMMAMEPGDQVIFYHSSCEPPGVAGLAKVSAKAAPDQTQFDKKSEYFDEKATLEKPRWFCTEIQYEKTFKNYLPLENLKKEKALKDMTLLQKGSRLSVQPVTEKEFSIISKLGEK
jgi:predicted RNA-binding protein with PUA-like domain